MRKVQSRSAQGRRTFIVGALVAAGLTVARDRAGLCAG